MYPELHFTGQVWRPPYEGAFAASASDLGLHLAQMQVLQPLPWHSVQNVATHGNRGRP